jgi:dTDP-glucose 4,6-dehydratase
VGAVLVTGGAGFIGANFVEYWLEAHPGDRVVVLDALTYAGNRASLQAVEGRAAFEFVHGDICDGDFARKLIREREISTIVHFAAESHVDRSIVGPEEFLRTNVLGTQSLLQAARAVWMPDGTASAQVRFHHISTDEVYGSLGPDDPAFSEGTPYAPNSPYAASKAASDHLVRAYHHTYGLPVTTSNCSNNYGPYQFPEKLIPLFVTNALDGRKLPLYGDGSQIRDWLHVRDHCRALDLLLDRGENGEVYNVGGGNEVRNIDLTRRILELVGGPASLIEPVADRPGHDARYSLDTTKVRRLGWSPGVPFEEGLRETVDWYRSNEWWWRPIKDADPEFQAYYRSQYGGASEA